MLTITKKLMQWRCVGAMVLVCLVAVGAALAVPIDMRKSAAVTPTVTAGTGELKWESLRETGELPSGTIRTDWIDTQLFRSILLNVDFTLGDLTSVKIEIEFADDVGNFNKYHVLQLVSGTFKMVPFSITFDGDIHGCTPLSAVGGSYMRLAITTDGTVDNSDLILDYGRTWGTSSLDNI